MAPPRLVIVTAEQADHKTFNKLLVMLHDFEFVNKHKDSPELDEYYILTKKEIPKLILRPDEGEAGETGTTAGSFNAENSSNVWAGKSYEEVEEFWRENWEKEPAMLKKNHTCLLVLDDQGLADETMIVAVQYAYHRDQDLMERVDKGELDEDEMARQDDMQPIKFDKVRVPWPEVWIMVANLEIANQDFEDYVDEDEGPDENHWWTYPAEGRWEQKEEAVKAREQELARLRGEGKIRCGK